MLLRLCVRSLGLLILIAIALASPPAATAPRAQPKLDSPTTKFGIIYGVWHCLALNRTKGKPWSIALALAEKQMWGPVPEFHFWGEPQDGYYCLSNRPDILQKHAKMLRDAGVDFIIIDATNNEYSNARTPDSPEGVVKPFKLLLEEWSKIDGAPKVVPHAPLTKNGDMFAYMMQLIDDHPNLRLIYEGKPLGIVASDATRYVTDTTKYNALSARYTLRRMWGHQRQRSNVDRSEWSFLEICQEGFLASGGTAKCRQRKTIRNGKVEQIPIATAYQRSYISDKRTAVPKFGGRTFVQQFETLFEAQITQNVPIAIIAGWNEWMAQRFCLNLLGKATDKFCITDQFADGTKVFVDAYDVEYNRDIEPSKTRMGDFYYRLMTECIAKYRAGTLCKTSDVKRASQ